MKLRLPPQMKMPVEYDLVAIAERIAPNVQAEWSSVSDDPGRATVEAVLHLALRDGLYELEQRYGRAPGPLNDAYVRWYAQHFGRKGER